MKLDIITPDKSIFSGEVKLVQVPGTKGSFQVLKNHAPIISTIEAGEIKVVTDIDLIEHYKISSGIIEVNNNIITILAEQV